MPEMVPDKHADESRRVLTVNTDGFIEICKLRNPHYYIVKRAVWTPDDADGEIMELKEVTHWAELRRPEGT
jgi:hypothetical protein